MKKSQKKKFLYDTKHSNLYCLKEQRHPDFPYSERHLQCFWYDSQWRPASFYDSNGVMIKVVNPGTWNLEAGPDFLDATIEVGNTRITGDVEIHIDESDWFAHGHNNNPDYAGVIALVSYFPCTSSKISRLPRNIIRISLAQVLAKHPEFSFDCIDITAYPYSSVRTQMPPCAQVLANWDINKRLMLLKSAGEERLRIKRDRLILTIQKKEKKQVLYEEIMTALGYKHNSLAFRMLASRVPYDVLRKEAGGNVIRAYALLLGVAGLLPAEVSTALPQENRAFIRSLWDEWWRLQTGWQKHVLPANVWRFSGVRPANHPVRRLAAAACLFGRTTELEQEISNMDTSSPLQWKKNITGLFSDTDALVFWQNHLTFFDRKTHKSCSVLGAQRIAAILTNVIIPFLNAQGTDTSHLEQYLPAAEDNIIVRRTAYRLFGHDCPQELYSTALIQQGLIQIFYDFCLTCKTNCASCVFPAQLQKIDRFLQ